MQVKIGFQTLGCKVNIYESNALKNAFLAKGYEISDDFKNCDVLVINTCSVTNMADAKSRRLINKMREENEQAILCVIGCYSQTNAEAKELKGVDIILGNGNKGELLPLVEAKLSDRQSAKKEKIIDISAVNDYEPLEVTIYDHTRAFVKIEDGCDNFCAYCIIPYARGKVRSKPYDDVISELKRITAEGYLEVVLAGIHTGRYNFDGVGLSDLIEKILEEVPNLARLRLSSIEINEIDDKFINLLATNSKLADHLHLPLQSGSDEVLGKMERRYDTSFFRNKVEKIRKVRPDISLTTDVIAGFPYETEEEFAKSKKFIEEINFSKLHVFPYSIRKGTKAELMPQIPAEIKKRRAAELIELSKLLESEYAKKFIGKEVCIIVEQQVDGNLMVGHTGNYLQVYLPLNVDFIKKPVSAKIVEYKNGRLFAILLPSK